MTRSRQGVAPTDFEAEVTAMLVRRSNDVDLAATSDDGEPPTCTSDPDRPGRSRRLVLVGAAALVVLAAIGVTALVQLQSQDGVTTVVSQPEHEPTTAPTGVAVVGTVVEVDGIGAAQARWNGAAVGDYRLRYASQSTPDNVAVVTVLVEDGETMVVDVGRANSESTPVWTIEDLFSIIAHADVVHEAVFDATWGYPTLLSVDPDENVANDDIRVEVVELFTPEEIAAAALDLQAWLPESVEPSAALVDLMQQMRVRRSDGTEIGDSLELGDFYLLHDKDQRQVYLFHHIADMCLLNATRQSTSTTAEYVSFSAGCQSVTQFTQEGTWTAEIASTFETAHTTGYVVVIPPARYMTEDWTIEVISERDDPPVDLTPRSALVVFTSDDPVEVVQVVVRCPCGDLTYFQDIG